MQKRILFFSIPIIVLILIFTWSSKKPSTQTTPINQNDSNIISGTFDKSRLKPEAEWKKILTPDEYHILREQGTEIPFTGALDHETRPGTYYSVGCNEPVFRSEQKYDSGTGWPSFWQPIKPDALVLREDTSIPGEPRVEVLDICGGHLGHVFADGPLPTGKRYCMNSLALKFIPDKNPQLTPH